MRFGIVAMAAGALALAGCNLLPSRGGEEPEANKAEVNSSGGDQAKGPEPEEEPGSRRGDGDWIVGRWINQRFNGSCEDPGTIIEYTGGGQVRYAGRHVADWTMEGNRLTQSGGRGEPTSGPVDREGNDRFTWNETGPFIRCEGEAGGSGDSGRSSARAPLDGIWQVRFVASGVTYSGNFDAAGDEGILTLAYTADGEYRRVRQRCSIRGGREIAIACRDPQMVEGSGEYIADNFFLEAIDGSTLRGAITSQPGERGTVTFTRR